VKDGKNAAFCEGINFVRRRRIRGHLIPSYDFISGGGA